MTDDINNALEVLRNGGIILYPTDTIWGIGCDATNEEAVKNIFKLKQREDSKSVIILVDNMAKIDSYVDEIPEIADQLIEVSENPLTVILEGAKNLAKNVINASDDSIAVRKTNDPFSKQLISRFKKPIVSTSANISNMPSPTIFDEISEEIINGVDYVVKHRQDDINKAKPSGIILVRKDSSIKVIRQ